MIAMEFAVDSAMGSQASPARMRDGAIEQERIFIGGKQRKSGLEVSYVLMQIFFFGEWNIRRVRDQHIVDRKRRSFFFIQDICLKKMDIGAQCLRVASGCSQGSFTDIAGRYLSYRQCQLHGY